MEPGQALEKKGRTEVTEQGGQVERRDGRRQIEVLGSHRARNRRFCDPEFSEDRRSVGCNEGVGGDLNTERRTTQSGAKERVVVLHGREEGIGGGGSEGSEAAIEENAGRQELFGDGQRNGRERRSQGDQR